MQFHGTKLRNIHIIAHSLGTFAADVVGRHYRGDIGRISGLDPGGPGFDGLSPGRRLDKTDAMFVDVIHTDTQNTSLSLYGRGTAIAVGHVDFYPNGGSDQPGCTMQRFEDLITRPIGEGIRRFVACHHYRSVDYYLETISPIIGSKCLMIGYECDSYADFEKGRCSLCDDTTVVRLHRRQAPIDLPPEMDEDDIEDIKDNIPNYHHCAIMDFVPTCSYDRHRYSNKIRSSTC